MKVTANNDRHRETVKTITLDGEILTGVTDANDATGRVIVMHFGELPPALAAKATGYRDVYHSDINMKATELAGAVAIILHEGFTAEDLEASES